MTNKGKNMVWVVLLAIAILLAGYAWLQRSQKRKQEDEQRARYQALQKQTRYTAQSFACSVEFPSGYAHRVTAYDPFTFRGKQAELATCNTSTEGEAWAEFYALGPGEDAEAFVKTCFADETHRPVQTRLSYLFDFPTPEAGQLAGKFQVLDEQTRAGWQVRLSYVPTPHGVGQFKPLQVPQSELRQSDIVAQLPTYGIPSNTNQTLSPWIWIGVDDFRSQADRDAFRRAERAALEQLKNRQAEFQKQKERFARTHRHFYLVEAAKAVSSSHVVVLRQFGSIASESTPGSGMKNILGMIESTRCP